VRHRVRPPALLRDTGKGLCVLAGAAALQAMEQHQVLFGRAGRRRSLQMVHINEISIRRGPAFTHQGRRLAQVAA
jgi:hypothetical protein